MPRFCGSFGRCRISYNLAAIHTRAFSGTLAFGPLPLMRESVGDIADWGGTLVLSVLTEKEIAARGAQLLPTWLVEQGISWLHLPIKDLQAPDMIFEVGWSSHGKEILYLLQDGEKVLIHCYAGFGRSGTVAARTLIDAGVSVENAIASVRAARPGAIESRAQEDYLRRVAD